MYVIKLYTKFDNGIIRSFMDLLRLEMMSINCCIVDLYITISGTNYFVYKFTMDRLGRYWKENTYLVDFQYVSPPCISKLWWTRIVLWKKSLGHSCYLWLVTNLMYCRWYYILLDYYNQIRLEGLDKERLRVHKKQLRCTFCKSITIMTPFHILSIKLFVY